MKFSAPNLLNQLSLDRVVEHIFAQVEAAERKAKRKPARTVKISIPVEFRAETRVRTASNLPVYE